ncbi:non-homologous end-joining DNA ligase [Sinorhizobium sp. RAC02]|uniref:non-homologous end-joining DNA ligase n=1 Tax=Sinorhizobium sp. RAC02 TaxID=1842534 RepID=UPI00083D0472|nr:non-homologous end-joining DNA ligase [Sinorhizobium sp. RAC02]AOF93722.1 DNA ligase D [Sinorhizobium sp. RAC02]
MTSKRRQTVPLLNESSDALQSRPLRKHDPDQPSLPFDAMPDRIKPCLARSKPSPPQGSDWVYEVKWGGCRIAVHIDPGGVRVITSEGHDWTHRFPSIVAAARDLGTFSAILDGEAVVLDGDGCPDFEALQRSLGGRGGTWASSEAIFYAVDLLYLDGHDLTETELSARRHALEVLVPADRTTAIRLSEQATGNGSALLAQACELGFEGIIAKRRDRPYRSGRTGDWLEITCLRTESFIIVGYEHSPSAPSGIGSLLLAGREGLDWVPVGAVDAGFDAKEAASLRQMLDRLKTRKPVVPITGENLVFAQPTLIADIAFRGWTGNGSLRHASYRGLREIQDNAAIFDMAALPATKPIAAV